MLHMNKRSYYTSNVTYEQSFLLYKLSYNTPPKMFSNEICEILHFRKLG